MQLNYHTAAVNRETTANLLCTKYIAILQYVKSAFRSRAFAIDQEAHAILIRNRATNIPDRIGVPLDQVLENLWDHYETPDETAKSEWELMFDTPRTMSKPILNFLSRWTTSITRLNNSNRPCTNHFLILKFKLVTPHDPRIKTFIADLKRLHPGTQRWDQLMDFAMEQEANLNDDYDDVRQAFAAYNIPAAIASAATVQQAGGAATTATAVPTKKTITYCFVHGKRAHHSSASERIQSHLQISKLSKQRSK